MHIVFFCLILIFTIFIGILFSKIKINIEKIELNIKKINFKVKIEIFLFGFIKIFKLELNELGIKIFGKIIKYKKVLKDTKINFKKQDLKKLKEMNIKIDLAKFTLKLGTEDVFITTFLVVIISSIIAEILKKAIKKVDCKKMDYKVLPEFNKNEIYFDGKIAISAKLICIIWSLKDNNKKKEVSKI